MKPAIFFTLIAAVSSQVAAAIPHNHGRQHEHAKKDVITEVVTETTYVTAAPTDPAVIVWVDTDGNIVSIETRTYNPSVTEDNTSLSAETTADVGQTTQLSELTKSSSTTTVLPATSSSIALSSPAPGPTSSASSPSPAPETSEALPAVPTDQNSAGKPVRVGGDQSDTEISGYGIAYDLIGDDGGCKSAATVKSDFDTFGGAFRLVRIYSTDCNAVSLVAVEAANRNMKVMVGIGNNHIKSDLATNIALVISQAGSHLATIDTIAIGNEYVGMGAGAVGDIVSAIATARQTLRGVFNGRIVTVDTFAALIANPQLCSASDYCAANCHAYFTESISASGAGAYVEQMMASIASANPGKEIVITESGWPWKSTDPSNTRASAANQAVAIASLKGSFSSDIVLFQGFDTMYKQPGSSGIEQFWGIYDH